MRTVGLFAGIGGFELGLQNAGHETLLFCEIKPEASAVLASRFPGIPIVSNIRELDSLPKNTELVCAGFPCQDLSQAGLTVGLKGKNSGLVHDVFRLLQRKRVPWLVLENVPFMLKLNGGRAMLDIIEMLEQLGYRWAYRVVDTYSFGLPQRRERVYLVASLDGYPEDVLLSDDSPLNRPKTELGRFAHGFYWTEGKGGLGWAVDAVPTLKNGSTIGIPSPPAILMPAGQIIKPDIRDTERMQGFAADWTLPAETVDRASLRWGLVGSAVSVPVAHWLGIRLAKPGKFDSSRSRGFAEAGKLPKAAYGDGQGRCSVEISTDPIGKQPQHLDDFLRYEGGPLSARATGGFYRRAINAKLRFADGFLDAVERHLVSVSGSSYSFSALRK
jgi:DNA (cytosine-5)-methyltransferase 1